MSVSEGSLLPRDASKWERSISEAVAAWYSVPNHLLDTIWDARTCPPAVLPFLAWAVGLPLWAPDWPLTKKRSVVASWPAISRIRGTKDGFIDCLDIVDAKFVDWVVPPAICAPRPARTQAERDAFKAQFPEVRVYLFAKQAVRKALLIPGKPWFGYRRVTEVSTAPERGPYRAEYRDGNLIKPIAYRAAATADNFAAGTFVISAPDVGRRLVTGKPWFSRNRFVRASSAASRVYAYSEGPSRPDLLWPSAKPIQFTPDKVSEQHVVRNRLVVGRPWGGLRRCPAASVADQFVYDSIRLFIPDRPIVNSKARRSGWILGRSQLGQDRFRIDVLVDTSYQRPGRWFMPGQVLKGAVASHDNSRTKEVCAALRAAKLGRDKVMLRTGLYRAIEPTDSLLPGAYMPGQIIRTE